MGDRVPARKFQNCCLKVPLNVHRMFPENSLNNLKQVSFLLWMFPKCSLNVRWSRFGITIVRRPNAASSTGNARVITLVRCRIGTKVRRPDAAFSYGQQTRHRTILLPTWVSEPFTGLEPCRIGTKVRRPDAAFSYGQQTRHRTILLPTWVSEPFTGLEPCRVS
jgi:hypothetical protein